jgi:hypothetical protein
MRDAMISATLGLAEIDPDSSGDSSDAEEYQNALEGALVASLLCSLYRAREDTTQDVNLRMLDLARLDAWYDGEWLCENTRFEREHIVTFLQELRIPDVMILNGSRYTKLEAILVTLRRGATAGQGNQHEPVFGLDRRRMSELKCKVSELMDADHCKTMRTLAPWYPDLDDMVDSVAAKAGQAAADLGVFCFGDGHFHECARPYEPNPVTGQATPYGLLQQSVFSGHTRAHGWTWLTLQGANGLALLCVGPVEARRGDGYCFDVTDMDHIMARDLNPAQTGGQQYASYFDSAFPHRPYAQKRFHGNAISALMKTMNSELSGGRISVEWSYGKNYRIILYGHG